MEEENNGFILSFQVMSSHLLGSKSSVCAIAVEDKHSNNKWRLPDISSSFPFVCVADQTQYYMNYYFA